LVGIVDREHCAAGDQVIAEAGLPEPLYVIQPGDKDVATKVFTRLAPHGPIRPVPVLADDLVHDLGPEWYPAPINFRVHELELWETVEQAGVDHLRERHDRREIAADRIRRRQPRAFDARGQARLRRPLWADPPR